MKLRKRFGVVLVLAMLVSVLAMTMTASAAKAKKAKISQKTASISVGKSVKLSIKNAKGKKVTWKSEDEDVAKVGSSGKVTGLAGGEATIVAKVGGKTYKCAVTVEAVQFKNLTTDLKPVLEVSGGTSDPTGEANKILGVNKQDLKPYVVTYPAGLALKWSSSNPAVAKVENGVVTAIANGDCVITVEAADGSGAADTVVTVVRGMGDDTTDPVVITMANKDRVFDKYVGKVKISTFFVDKDGNILKKGTPYATVDLDNKNAESWTHKEDGKDVDNKAYYKDEYYYYVKDTKVNPLKSGGEITLTFNSTNNKANFDGKKLGILADSEWSSEVKTNPYVRKDTATFGQVAFPKAASEIIVYKDAKGKAQNGFKQIVYSVAGVDGKTLLAAQYGDYATADYEDGAEYVKDGKKAGEYPWKLYTYSDETILGIDLTLYTK